MNPGDTQLTRTRGAHSRAAEAVRAITAAFAAEYGASPRVGRTPDTLATFTTAPGRAPAVARRSGRRRPQAVVGAGDS